MRFFPDQNPHFIAKIQKIGIIRIVARSDCVPAQIPDQLEILYHGCRRQRASEEAMVFMSVKAANTDGLIIEKDFCSFRADGSQACPLDQIIDVFSIFPQNAPNIGESGIFRCVYAR